MTEYLTRARRGRTAALAAAAALALGACGERAPSGRVEELEGALARDSALARDLAFSGGAPGFVPRDTALAPTRAPAPRRRPAAPQPWQRARPAPAIVERAAPPAVEQAPNGAEPVPEPAALRGLAAGTVLRFTTGTRVCTVTNRVGDKLIATLGEAALGVGGAVVPAGAKAVIEVATISPGGDGQAPRITFRVRALEVEGVSHRVEGEAVHADALVRTRSGGGGDVKKVIGGAIAGAVLGQVLGKDTRSTVAGAVAGAAAGGVAARASSGVVEGCLPAGATIRLVLDRPLSLAAR